MLTFPSPNDGYNSCPRAAVCSVFSCRKCRCSTLFFYPSEKSIVKVENRWSLVADRQTYFELNAKKLHSNMFLSFMIRAVFLRAV